MNYLSCVMFISYFKPMRTITPSQEGYLTAIIAHTPLEQMRLYELIREEQHNVDDLARGLKIRTSSQ